MCPRGRPRGQGRPRGLHLWSRGLNHCQFRQLLLEAESQYGDLLCFCNVRWLS